MEWFGIGFSSERFEQYTNQIQIKLQSLTSQIYHLAKKQFDLNDNKAVSKVTLTGDPTYSSGFVSRFEITAREANSREEKEGE